MKPETAIYTAFDEFDGFDPVTPERNLMRAILRTAMEDIRRSGCPYREAKRYFLSNDDKYLFSFLSICYHLDLCPKTIRTMLGLSCSVEHDLGFLAA